MDPGPLRQNPGIAVVFQRKLLWPRAAAIHAGEAGATVLAPTALAAKAWYGRTGREVKALEYYDTEIWSGWLASDAWAEIWRPFVGYVTYAFSELR